MSRLVDGRRWMVGSRSFSAAFLAAVGLCLMALLALPPASMGHAERESFFPDPDQGAFPTYRQSGPSHVVCKPGSRARINALQDQALREKNLRLLERCQFSDIQAAVNAAENGDRILVLPGFYQELPSRAAPKPSCQDEYDKSATSGVLSYAEQRRCPNAQNLIGIFGDTNGNRVCDSKCNIQIEGTGERPGDVFIKGDRAKLNIIRADRADGIHIRNMRLALSDFNNIYVLETNGFRVSHVVSWDSREYGILSFTSDHGIYEYCDTAYNGDSGIYPGAGPDRHKQPDAHGHKYGIRIHHCNSHRNAMGYSGTAGNGIYAYKNRFHHNATGLVTDSFVPNHPGMPQDAARFEQNLFYSNNNNLYTEERDAYCRDTPPQERDPKKVCPSFPLPVGTGMLIAGGNANDIESNYFFDNWRQGTMLFWVPTCLRYDPPESCPTGAEQYDTSSNNRYQFNCMGVRPASLTNPDFNCTGTTDKNGVDFWWDEEEGRDCDPSQPPPACVDNETVLGNCWSDNLGPNVSEPTSDPVRALLPECPGNDLFRPSNSDKTASLVPCATWNPRDNTDPPGCDWFTTPPEPN
jgi:hypothetical protein